VKRDLATGEEEPLTSPGAHFQLANDVSPDGGQLVFQERGADGTWDLWSLRLSPPGEPQELLRTAAQECCARFSPDGRALGFVSDESGRPEAYVMPYPGPGERRRISPLGSRALRFSREGREILFLSQKRMWRAAVTTTPSFHAAAPAALFDIAGKDWLNFDVSPDGSRFLALVREVVGNERCISTYQSVCSGI
jgi:Tol biopolymer transport system component